jgi:hypothetical protein
MKKRLALLWREAFFLNTKWELILRNNDFTPFNSLFTSIFILEFNFTQTHFVQYSKF